jgi:hypothetical protein
MARGTKSTIVVAVVVALMAAFGAAAKARAAAAGHACGYKAGKVVLVMTGATPALCKQFNAGFHGKPFHGHFGTMRCAFQMQNMPSILMGVFAEDATYGKMYCNILENNVKSSWDRVL